MLVLHVVLTSWILQPIHEYSVFDGKVFCWLLSLDFFCLTVFSLVLKILLSDYKHSGGIFENTLPSFSFIWGSQIHAYRINMDFENHHVDSEDIKSERIESIVN